MLNAAVFLVGVIFWVHGAKTHDRWFRGEQLTGEILTGFYIGMLGVACCCFLASARNRTPTNAHLHQGMFQPESVLKSTSEAESTLCIAI